LNWCGSYYNFHKEYRGATVASRDLGQSLQVAFYNFDNEISMDGQFKAGHAHQIYLVSKG
jgi:hypothetical protein